MPSLSFPSLFGFEPLDPSGLMEYEAVQLFVERSKSYSSPSGMSLREVRTAAQICSRLEGIPLAIELAAARMKVLSVEQITSRLNGSFHLLAGGERTALPRHRTLRATMEWSYSLLSENGEGGISPFVGIFRGMDARSG